MKTSLTLPSFVLAALAACSSGGGDSAPVVPPAGLHLLLDTRAGTGDLLEARVAAAAFERPDGSFTNDLLGGEKSVVLADPSGAVAGLTLQSPPPGSYRALRLLVVPGSGRVLRDDGGRREVEFERSEAKLAFAQPLEHRGESGRTLVASHPGPLVLRDAGARSTWDAALELRAPAPHPFDRLELEVVAVDRPAGTLRALLSARHAKLPVAVRFADDASFHQRQAHQTLTRAEFLGRVGVGDHIRARGWLDAGLGLTLTRAELHQRAFQNLENKVYGRVTSLDGEPRFTMQIVVIARGNANPARVQVDGSRAHWHDDHQLRSYSDLTVGAWVEVEWRGAGDQSPIPAQEIEIEDACGVGPEIEGQVAEVRVAEQLVVAVPRKDDPLLVAGKPVARAELKLAPNARLFRNDRERQPISLDDVKVGERVHAIGTLQPSGQVLVTWMRIRSR